MTKIRTSDSLALIIGDTVASDQAAPDLIANFVDLGAANDQRIADIAARQPLDSDLTAIAALDSSTAGAIASDGSGWVKKTYAQLKTALGLVKADVGLGNVDNTSDVNKPVSTATQTALDARSLRFIPQGAAKTASYSMASWHVAHYDTTSGAIVQPLPASPTTGDRVRAVLDAGTNAVSFTFGGNTVSSLSTATHTAELEYNGTTWEHASGWKSQSSLDAMYGLFVNVKDPKYGVKGDGTTDDTIAIQSAVTAAQAAMGTLSGYGTSFMAMAKIFFPPGIYVCSGITAGGRIHFTGSGARLKASASGYILSLSGESNLVSGLMFDGNGVGTGAAGITINSGAHFNRVTDCRFQDFAGRAVLAASGSLAPIVDNIFAENCLLNTGALTGYSGVVEMAGADGWFHHAEITASRTSLSTNGYACACAVTGGNNWVESIQAETSDSGMYINSPSNAALKIIGVRADLNRGHGWIVAGGTGIIANCHSYKNGLDANNTYNGFEVSGGTFQFTACRAESTGSPAHLQGFHDTQNSLSSQNSYINCWSTGHGLKAYNVTNVGPRIALPNTSWMTAATSTATISVDQICDLRFVNTGAQTVTSLSNGVNGQLVRLYGDGYTTVQNNASHVTASGADLLLAANKVYQFIRQNAIWYQVSTDLSNVAPLTDVQVFTANGTWTKPTTGTPRVVDVFCIGGGGGGGSGRRGAAGSVRCGGGGGGSGGITRHKVAPALLGATEPVVVAPGGTGGAAVTADSTDGNAGGSATQTYLGASATTYAIWANGGGGGAAGTATAGTGGTGGAASDGNGVSGGAASASGGAGGSGNATSLVGGGGGAGGGISSGDVAGNGGTGGAGASRVGGGANGTSGGGGSDGTTLGTNAWYAGGGGGGGAASIAAASGGGGNGALYGAGAGGGGASLNGNNSGKGGDGAGGLIVVTTYF